MSSSFTSLPHLLGLSLDSGPLSGAEVQWWERQQWLRGQLSFQGRWNLRTSGPHLPRSSSPCNDKAFQGFFWVSTTRLALPGSYCEINLFWTIKPQRITEIWGTFVVSLCCTLFYSAQVRKHSKENKFPYHYKGKSADYHSINLGHISFLPFSCIFVQLILY
jgi:hypothetical protein